MPGKPPLVSIIILNWNGKRFVQGCLRSIKKNTSYPNYEVIVVDNGSTDGSVAILRKLKKQGLLQELVLNRENKGFSAGNNQGFAAAKGSFFLMLNNDTTVTKNWLGNSMRLMLGDEAIAAVGCRLIDLPFWKRKQYRLYPDREVKTTCGAAMLIRKKVVEKIGALDAEHFSPIYGEETDWCFRARNAGYRIMETDKAIVVHLGSHDTRKGRGKADAFELLNNHRMKAMLFNLTIPGFLAYVPGLLALVAEATVEELLGSLFRAWWSNLRNWREIAVERKKRGAKLF